MKERITGYVMPIGGGGVGKTSIAQGLESYTRGLELNPEIRASYKKTINLELDFITSTQRIGGNEYSFIFQFLTPPGQTDIDPTGRSFERIIDIYRDFIKRIDVFIFTYKLSNKETFDDLVP